MSDDVSTTFELPTGSHAVVAAISKWEKLQYELKHPENHKQSVRFLCVGAFAYVVNLLTFTVCSHFLKIADYGSLTIGFVVSAVTNFFLSRHWTFESTEDHPVAQGIRFFTVSLVVFFFSTGMYALLSQLTHATGLDKTLIDGVAWAVAMPLSFLFQKLWTFKA